MGVFRKHGIALIGADAKDQRHLIAARPHAGKERLTDAILADLDTAVGGIEFNGYARNNTCAKCRCAFVLIADAAAVRAVLRAEASGQVYSVAFA